MKSSQIREGFSAPRSLFSRLAHVSFEVGIFLKGIDGLLEILGALLLWAVSPRQISQAVSLLTQHELSQDPHDFIANHLLTAANGFSASARTFAALFLLSHGALKVGLVWALWKSQTWAYPTAMAVFTAFGAYQIYRYVLLPSALLVALTVLDAIVIWLTWAEYRRLRGKGLPSSG